MPQRNINNAWAQIDVFETGGEIIGSARMDWDGMVTLFIRSYEDIQSIQKGFETGEIEGFVLVPKYKE